MCGRFTLATPADEIREELGLDDAGEDWPARYNIAPQQDILIVGRTEEDLLRPGWARWGLVPFWARDPKIGQRMINARAESLLSKPAFRDALRARRCLIPADGFYEWRRVAGGKQPVRFHLADDRLFTFAGIWDRWKDADGTSLFTCAIITTAPNDAVRPVHDRMPVIVPREAREAWLDPSADDDSLIGVLKPYPGTDLIGYAVSARVNSVANDDADCIEPFEERPEPQLDLSTEPTRR
jgi:putative SOS response-associated peptidase YedK